MGCFKTYQFNYPYNCNSNEKKKINITLFIINHLNPLPRIIISLWCPMILLQTVTMTTAPLNFAFYYEYQQTKCTTVNNLRVQNVC